VGEDGEILLIGGSSFEVLLGDLDDAVEDVGLELLQFLLVVGLHDTVDLAQRLAEFGVEVVLDAVVRPGWDGAYLASSLEPMMAHLLPSSLCRSNMRCSSE
jgi:hypothetical protein